LKGKRGKKEMDNPKNRAEATHKAKEQGSRRGPAVDYGNGKKMGPSSRRKISAKFHSRGK